MLGQRTCHAHGGRSRQARAAAEMRVAIERIDAHIAAWELARREWWVSRIVAAAEVIEMDPLELARHPNRGSLCLNANLLRPDLVSSIFEEPQLIPGR